MTGPLVCCVMLTRDRPEMARRAVECFRAQTYDAARRELLVYNSGDPAWFFDGSDAENEAQVIARVHAGRSIGALRNHANACTVKDSIIIHLDDDDWSHPNRIAEQVALLQSSGKECVGYREMLFWREPHSESGEQDHPQDCTCGTCAPGQRTVIWTRFTAGEAWLYRNTRANYCVGTSLCYWRRVWERRPFPDLPNNGEGTGEDTEWLRGVDSLGVSGISEGDPQPRMIASIHGGNTMHYDIEGNISLGSRNWERAPQWDDYCREKMRLEVRA